MTDQEMKRALSERLARLSEQAGLPTELVGQAHWRCPEGHLPDGWLGTIHKPLCGYGDDPHIACLKPIERVLMPFDLTNPTHLLPLVEAWLAKDSDREWASKYHDGEWIAWVKDLPRYPEPGSDPDRTVAEAQALCAAMEAEKGADHG